MNLLPLRRGLHSFAHVSQTLDRAGMLSSQRIKVFRADRNEDPAEHCWPISKVGLSSNGIRMWRIIAYGTKPGRSRGLLAAWSAWEHVAHRLWPTMPIPNAPYGLLRMRLRRYNGEPLALPDGTFVGKNVLVGELHCDNQVFVRLAVRERISLFHACREDLHSLAMWVQEDSAGAQVKAFFGRTLLAVGGARLGFAVRDVSPSAWRPLVRFFMIGLLVLYTDGGVDRLARGTTVLSYPKDIWMTRHQLLARYGKRDGYTLNPHREPNCSPGTSGPPGLQTRTPGHLA